MATIVVVDDEAVVLKFVGEALTRAGHLAVCAESGETALDLVSGVQIDAAVIDAKLPGMDGIDVLAALRQARPVLPCVVISGVPDYAVSLDRASRAVPFQFLKKPFDAHTLVMTLESSLLEPAVKSRERPDRTVIETIVEGFIGASKLVRQLARDIDRIAPTAKTVLIRGETGTGKELVSRAIHRRSGRSGRFVPLNCGGAGPDSLLESELFGHERGAFTGAIDRVPGWFEMANGGTLFLDEIGELSAPGQVKLLRVLEQRELTRLGGRISVPVDVRIVAATNRDLAKASAEGLFREDLLYRLSSFEIALPPLRERDGDVLLLVDHFLPAIAAELRMIVPTLSANALGRLAEYPWPGNVRELQQVLTRACMTDTDGILDTTDLPSTITSRQNSSSRTSTQRLERSTSQTLADVTRALECELIARALKAHATLADAARALGLTEKALYRKRLAHRLPVRNKSVSQADE